MSIVVFISGNGSNLQALIDAKINISLVVSNRKAAYGLVRAQNAGITMLLHQMKQYTDANKSRIEYDLDLAKKINELVPDIGLIVLAGWMHILSAEFLSKFKNVINLHPALPGAFDGANAIERAFNAFKKGEINKTGVMIHKVIPDVDRGEVILVREVNITIDDTLSTLEEKIHKVEHELIVEGTKIMLEKIKK